MPQSLYQFVWTVSGRHQAAVAVMSVSVFLLGTIPLEINRRIVNAAVEGKPIVTILSLVGLYLVCVVSEGLVKLGLNLYRNWIGERAVRWLRRRVFLQTSDGAVVLDGEAEGVQLAIVLAEAEPVGDFVGTAVSEPLLQLGVLVAVSVYLIYLQPIMGAVFIIVYCPQLAFVPAMQAAINRRVGVKVAVGRAISSAIVAQGGAYDADGTQGVRLDEIFSLNMGIYKIKFTMNFLMNLLTQFGYAAIFAIGGYLTVTRKIEIGTIAAFVAGLSKVNDPWGELVDWYRALRVTQVKYEMLRKALAN